MTSWRSGHRSRPPFRSVPCASSEGLGYPLAGCNFAARHALRALFAEWDDKARADSLIGVFENADRARALVCKAWGRQTKPVQGRSGQIFDSIIGWEATLPHPLEIRGHSRSVTRSWPGKSPRSRTFPRGSPLGYSGSRNDRPLFEKTGQDSFVYTLIDVTCKQRFLSP